MHESMENPTMIGAPAHTTENAWCLFESDLPSDESESTDESTQAEELKSNTSNFKLLEHAVSRQQEGS